MCSQTKITFDICVKIGLISLVALLCAGTVYGREIAECQMGINESYITNTRVNCNAYKLIFCNGSQSQFCVERNDCNESYDCESTPSATVPPATVPPATVPPATVPPATALPVNDDNTGVPPLSTDLSNTSTEDSTIASSTSTESSTTDSPITDGSTTQTDVRRECGLGVNAKFVFPGNCNYYYHCIDGYLLVQQCPFGYYFNAPAGVCLGPVSNVNYYC